MGKCGRAFILWLAVIVAAVPALAGEIHIAAGNGDLEAVKEMLGADPKLLNAGNEQGRGPLHMAAFSGRQEVAAFLLDRGADINMADSFYSLTPPFHATTFSLIYLT